MSEKSIKRNPIRVLNAEVARKIAAGEVIDRPNAIVRELMDNAVDSGAKNITVEVFGGGIDKIRIIDDGCGINEEDLHECAKPHATSKIQTETDLLHLTTLGFRGEALASIAAVSRLTILSGNKKLRASVTEDHLIETAQNTDGTIVQSEALFENFPARRRFLKKAASEMLMCKNTFIEKTLPKPEIAFKFNVDSQTKLNLPKNQTLAERFVQALSLTENSKLFYEIQGSGQNFSFKLVIGEMSVNRNDKKHIFIYVNDRRITEYSLLQAIEYGCQGYFPNGVHPVAALFVQMSSEVVDFNIHPAKKEARFQDISELHHVLSSSIRNFFKQYTLKAVVKSEQKIAENKELFENGLSFEQLKNYETQLKEKESQKDFRTKFFSPSYLEEKSAVSKSTENSHFEKSENFSQCFSKTNLQKTENFPAPNFILQNTQSSTSYDSAERLATQALSIAEKTENCNFKYIGNCLGVFLLAEKNDSLYLIDQHAAHERILYNKIMANQGKKQNLLVPYIIETTSVQEDEYLEKISEALEAIGFSNKKCENGQWEISSIPERWKGSETDLYKAILTKYLEPEEIISSIAAMSACKAAIKDGYILDRTTASDLAREALELEDPHCPHGRPIFTAITREKLFELVKRT